MTEINIVGTCYNDLVLYLCRILKCLNRKLLIRDMTRRHEFFSSVPQIQGVDPRNEVLDYLGISYTFGERNGRYLLEKEEEIDTVIRLYDSDMLPDYCCSTIIVTDESKQPVDQLSQLEWERISTENCFNALVIRNYTGAVRSQFDGLIKKAGVKKVFPIPISSSDVKCGILAEHKDVYRFTSISTVFREALTDIAASVSPKISVKELQKAYRQAEKGGTFS